MSKRDEFAALRETGLTYREIGEIYGCSRQNVEFHLAERKPRKGVSENKCAYDGLRNWMNENHVCISDLLRKMYGCEPSNSEVKRCSNLLKGKARPKMEEIDAIISATGLSYEELFRKGA